MTIVILHDKSDSRKREFAEEKSLPSAGRIDIMKTQGKRVENETVRINGGMESC